MRVQRIIHRILIAGLMLGTINRASAQKGFYVPAGGKVFFAGDSSTIFSNVINAGTVGVGKPATVNFVAKSWENTNQARITDAAANGNSTTGEGGWVRFISDTTRQEIVGGYNAATRTGASFPKLRIENRAGVELQAGGTKVRNQVDLQKGLFYLNDQVLVVGNDNPGVISGYDSTKYFVTGNKPGTGLLLREKLDRNDGIVVFPVGSKDRAYTPAGVRARMRQTADYYVGVFDGVQADDLSPADIAARSVNKTWQIGKIGSSSTEESDIFLEHEVKDEGVYFAQNRDMSYISQYTANRWDEGFPQRTPTEGMMSTSGADASNGLNMRNFNNLGSSDHYYTKLSGEKATKTRLWFNAYRIDTGLVKVYWKTNPEVNVKSFVIERRFSSQTAFFTVAAEASKAPAGYSVIDLKYERKDPNSYTGVSLYRLRMVGYDGSISYSEEVPVGPVVGIYQILLWPNPAVSWFNIGIPSEVPAKAVVIHDLGGRKLREESVNGRTVIRMTGLLPGAYFISIISTSENIIETRKLIVAGGQ